MGEDDVLGAVGARLRDVRTRQRRTLADVAAATGISVSTLSRLESGSRRATLDLLLPLARTYRVPLDDLVGAPDVVDPRIRPRPVQRGGQIHIPLTHPDAPVQAVKLVLPGRDPAEPVRARRHEGYEWFYVLSGTVRLELGGVVTVLGAGEAAEFDTRVPHAILNDDEHRAVELLALFSPQGERIHVHGG
ncbi:helix-turn-helix domain-containing protein [Cellulomonas carbonis]|uniref:XRE family transcriptional regulator n=1 Tax=Cellulomonas carbonis T26 TaxID=947969 RepID=A0A0A0BLN4_9CELL|nr:XRE family transcriptional regulator [Cellulomonas carbonis]KGM08602.1 XRE family transcriptional regulator [Cellulomonas carbonis T26]GGC13687.1 hypothetical protein GCM10010972_28770 [Cellulomonas carbonis]